MDLDSENRSAYGGIDDADKNQADPRCDQNSANIIQSAYSFLPWHAPGMLRRMVEQEQADHGNELSDEAAIEDVFPPIPGIDSIATHDRANDDDDEYETIREGDTG